MKWRTIDSAPTDGTPVLLWGKLEGEIHAFDPHPEIIVGKFEYGRWSMANTDGYEVNCYADMWMPLVPPPGGQIEEEPSGDDEVSAADRTASLTQKIEAQSAIISEKNDLIDKLEAERETLITELERLLKQLGRKDLSL